MEMTGEQLIHASQADTWAALNDPEVLKACVPGCESIEQDQRHGVRGADDRARRPGERQVQGQAEPVQRQAAALLFDRVRGPGRRGGIRQGRRRREPHARRPSTRSSPTRSRRTSAASSRRSARGWWTRPRTRWRTISSSRSTRRSAKPAHAAEEHAPRRASSRSRCRAIPDLPQVSERHAVVLRRRRAGGVRGRAAHVCSLSTSSRRRRSALG